MKKCRTNRRLGLALTVLIALSGCNNAAPSSSAPKEPAQPEAAQVAPPLEESAQEPEAVEAAPEPQPEREEPQAGPSYIEQVAKEIANGIVEPGMSEYEKAKAAFDYMIINTYLVDPVGLDLWRIRGDGREAPSFVENRSLSVLLYGAGMCEDYAAAFTMLLRSMGIEAEYVPGLTYSTEGALVDHAWTVAKIDGVWYHLDCQLEDNISRHGAIRYRYFMKSDATLAASHRWGQNLIDSRLLTAQQNEEIAKGYIPPACPQDYPAPARLAFTPAPMPDMAAINAQIDAELLEYEELHGPLEPLELAIIPPVFALEGYGPPD